MNAFEKWSVWVTSALTGLTGVGYFWTKHMVEATDPFAVVNHPLQPFFLKAHILVSPLLLVALGMILVRHVWKHFRLGVVWARKTGLTTFAVVAPMVVTGYLIQTVTGQGWLRAMVLAHLVTGFGYLAFLGLHQVAVARLRPEGEDRWLGTGPGRRIGGTGADAGPRAPSTDPSGPGALVSRPDSPVPPTGRGPGPRRGGESGGGSDRRLATGASSG